MASSTVEDEGMEQQPDAVFVAKDHDRFDDAISYPHGRFDLKVSAKDTDGALCIYELHHTKIAGPGFHLHHEQDEWFFVIEGDFVFQVGEKTYKVGPGASLFAPRKVPHAFVNTTNTGKLIILLQPAGTIEQLFRVGGAKQNVTAEERHALNRAHGLESVGPPLMVPGR